jgi:hypothetical protein
LVAIKKKKLIPFQIWGTLGSTADNKKRRANEKRVFMLHPKALGC